ncbi:MAG: SEC-C metal-binding domain-containing protein, partial [Elusimicrobiota bacterium]
ERNFGLDWEIPAQVSSLDRQVLRDGLLAAALERYSHREKDFEGFDFREVEKMILLQMIDKAWKGHLYDLDHLKKSIGLRAYGQKDPKIEYQKESFAMFEVMLSKIREQSVEYAFKVQAPRLPPPPPAAREQREELEAGARGQASGRGAKASPLQKTAEGPIEIQKIGRNDPCYCGSGKKFKKCHGA